MNEKFFDLAREKQDRMINGAMEVFAKNGYKHASTDDMVKAAGISKGLLFHYFGSKEGIYVFLYDYCVKYMLLELSTVVDEKETDYFELIKQIALAKTKAGRSYPCLTMFLEEAAHETEQDIVAKTAESRRIYDEHMEALIKSAEIESVSDKTRRERIKKLLDYTISSIIREKTREKANSEAVYREIKAYIELVKEMACNLPESKKEESGFLA
ncbi:MAG: TetR/AcrR family transcriptional regulator [Lachnospiraceae bacterium]|nr:TetR/AcrR family transcriptional regulator [Lachnospiraceae bacterium]MBO5145563.1 TetR/AcrR family transcriptional regulator [Lachnospiraceae bacterium]